MSGLTVNSITISGANYTIGGSNTLSLGGGLSNTGANNTVSVPLALTAAETVSAAASTSLTLSGNVTEGANLLTVAGAGSTTISGVLSGTGGLAKNDGGTLTLGAANSGLSGNVTVSAGVVNVGNTVALGSGTVTENGGKVSLQALASIAMQFNPAGSGTSLLTTDSTGVVAQTYWTVTVTGAQGTAANNGTVNALHDSNNNATTANVTWTAVAAWVSAAGAGTFAKLMSNDIKPNVQANGITINLTNIPYNKYDVYIYYNDNQNHSEFSTYDTHTTYYGQTDNGLTTFQQITSTAAGTYGDGNYVEFAGETTSSLTITQTGITGGGGGICGFQIVNASVHYANNFVVTGNATLDVPGTAAATIGSLTIGSQTLSVTGGSTGANTAYTLTTGTVTLTGNPTIDVANNGTGAGTLTLGSLNDGGTTARTDHHPGQRHGDARQRCHQPNQRHRRQRQRHIDPEFQQRHCSREPG